MDAQQARRLVCETVKRSRQFAVCAEYCFLFIAIALLYVLFLYHTQFVENEDRASCLTQVIEQDLQQARTSNVSFIEPKLIKVLIVAQFNV